MRLRARRPVVLRPARLAVAESGLSGKRLAGKRTREEAPAGEDAGAAEEEGGASLRGRIKNVIWDRGYGFIAADDGRDYFFHINLSLRGSNMNQVSYDAGLAIYRAGGFFQDPQIAGAFLACLVTFLLVLSLRGRFAFFHDSRR